MHIGFDRPHRAFHDQFHTDGGGQMKDDVALVDEFGDDRAMMHAFNRVLKFGMLAQMPDIGHAAGGKVVQRVDFVAPRQVGVGEVRSDEARAAGDQNPHEDSSRKV